MGILQVVLVILVDSGELDRIKNAFPATLVKETLGHESLATTSKYTHARPDDSSAQYLAV